MVKVIVNQCILHPFFCDLGRIKLEHRHSPLALKRPSYHLHEEPLSAPNKFDVLRRNIY
jgi:hypothetical protein